MDEECTARGSDQHNPDTLCYNGRLPGSSCFDGRLTYFGWVTPAQQYGHPSFTCWLAWTATDRQAQEDEGVRVWWAAQKK